MRLTAIRESTIEIGSPKKYESDVNSEDLTGEQAQAITAINTKFNITDKGKNFILQIRISRFNSFMTITIGEQTRK